MRKIKFRAYRAVYGDDNLPVMTKPFTLGNLQDKEDFDFTNGSYASWNEFGLEHEDTVVMQFTQLVDKNNVEIYEHDIINHPLVKGTVEVVWYNGCWCIKGVKGGICSIYDDAPTTNYSWEVIGNSLENPELIK